MRKDKLNKYLPDGLKKDYLKSDHTSIYELEMYILDKSTSLCIDELQTLAEDNTQKILESIEQEIRIIRLEHIIKKLLKRVNSKKTRV